MPETVPPSLLDRAAVLSCLPAQAAALPGELDVQAVIDSTNLYMSRVAGIDENGALLLDTGSDIQEIHGGEVSLRPQS